MQPIPEIDLLLKAVETRLGRPIRTTRDFELLSAKLNSALGATTLKRLWGYISDKATPRLSTLDVLSRYSGSKDFEDFRASLKKGYSSEFRDSGTCLTAAELKAGDRASIAWDPDRRVTLKYLGDNKFEVLESEHSKLCQGDVIEASVFMKGWPLQVSGILRNGALTPPYVAGKAHGLSSVEKL